MLAPPLAPPPGINCLIFDWDGTLVDSHEANHASLAEALGLRGVALSRAWFDSRTGLSTADMIDKLVHDTGAPLDVAVAEVVRDRDAAFLRLAARVKEITPVADVLRSCRTTHRTAVASGGHRAMIRATGPYESLSPFVDCWVTRDDVSAGKPAPDLFLAVCDRLGVEPGSCLVYEDSDEGLQAAATAGMRAVDVRTLLG